MNGLLSLTTSTHLCESSIGGPAGSYISAFIFTDYRYIPTSYYWRLISIAALPQFATQSVLSEHAQAHHGYCPSFDKKHPCSASLSPLRILTTGAAPSAVGLAPLAALLCGPKLLTTNPGVYANTLNALPLAPGFVRSISSLSGLRAP